MMQLVSQLVQQIGSKLPDDNTEMKSGTESGSEQAASTFTQTLMSFLGMKAQPETPEGKLPAITGQDGAEENGKKMPDTQENAVASFAGAQFMHRFPAEVSPHPAAAGKTATEAQATLIEVPGNSGVLAAGFQKTEQSIHAVPLGGSKEGAPETGKILSLPANQLEQKQVETGIGHNKISAPLSEAAEGKQPVQAVQTEGGSLGAVQAKGIVATAEAPAVQLKNEQLKQAMEQNTIKGEGTSGKTAAANDLSAKQPGQNKEVPVMPKAAASMKDSLKAEMQTAKQPSGKAASEQPAENGSGKNNEHANGLTRKPAQAAGSSTITASVPLPEKSPVKTIQPPVIAADPAKFAGVEITAKTDMDMEAGADKDSSSKDHGNTTALRLGGGAITSLGRLEGRRAFGVQLARSLQETGTANTTAENWKHHRFVLDDGSKVNVSARHSDGTLQLQLHTGNPELTKIIQQHLDDIQQHLQEQMDVNINLQLQDFGSGQSGQGEEAADGAAVPGSSFGAGKSASATDSEKLNRPVRYLGFNNNEWTA